MKKLKNIVNIETLSVTELMRVQGAVSPDDTTAADPDGCTNSGCENDVCSSRACRHATCVNSPCSGNAG